MDTAHHREDWEHVATVAQHLAENYCGRDADFVDPAAALETYGAHLRMLGVLLDRLRADHEGSTAP